MRGLVLIFLFTAAFIARGQDKDPNLSNQDIRNLDTHFIVPSFNLAYEGVYGTPYLYSDWASGMVIMSSGDTIKNQDLNYDIYQDELLALNKRTGKTIIPMQGVLRSFVIVDSLNHEHVFINTLPDQVNDESGRKGFYEVLYQGDLLLLAKHRKTFVKANYEGAYSANRPYDEFKTSTKRYSLIKKDGSYIELKQGKKGVLKSLNDDGTLGKIVKEKKLDLKKEKDLIDLIIFMDSM